MAQNIFRGLGIALVTPFDNEGQVDYDRLQRLVEFQLTNGADFLCILCTSSETPCLSGEEREAVKQCIVKLNRGRVPIVMGCGGNNTRAVVKELASTDFAGIDGILSVCPFYNKPSQEGLEQHFSAIAQVSPLPIILYNVPSRTGVNMSAETTLRLAHDHKNIVAIKEASGSMEKVKEIIKNKPEHFDVLSGEDALTFRMVAQGAAGAISVIGNALPRQVSQMLRHTFRCEYEEAQKIDDALSELYELLFVDGSPAGVKAMLSAMGFILNNLRLPLVPSRPATQEKIAQCLAQLAL